MLEKFSLEAQKLIALGESLAFDLSSSSIGKEHLFLAFLKNSESILALELKKYHISYLDFLSLINKTEQDDDVFFMEYTASFKLFLDRVIIKSKELKEERVSVDVLAYMLIEDKEGIVSDYLKLMKVDRKTIMNNISKQTKRKSELDTVIDLHELSKVKKDPLIGREKELEQLIRALRRRNKPNALIIGAPGIGKTAIVEELALLLAKNKVKGLEGKRIYELDLSSVVGGTKYRGEFEEKLKKIIKKVKEDGNAIIFIDEIHNIIKAGGAEGAIDASNILKPYLSRGEIQLIGATTIDEYHTTIAKDKALSRRFQIIKMNQSSKDETKRILLGLIPLYEDFYKIKIRRQLIDYIVDIADEYLSNRSFPDKAIDILDNSCVIANKELTIEDINSTIETFYNISVAIINKAKETKKELKSLIYGQDEAIEKIYRWLNMLEKGIRIPHKPLAVLMFVGPTGVGKSEAAKIIAKTFLRNEEAFIKLDMGSYQDVTSINKLIGSPPGYTGHEEKSSFIKTILAHPNSVILLDEIDKAHGDVLDFFLNVFDEGCFYDSRQEKIDCSNTIIIMTANSGFNENNLFEERIHINQEGKSSTQLLSKIRTKFKNEFINRIDDIIEFSFLDETAQKQLIFHYIDQINKDYSFELSSLEIDQDELHRYGARYIRRKVLFELSKRLEEKEKIK